MICYPSADFDSATPESQGVLSRGIADMIQCILEGDIDVHSMLLYRHGRLIFEQYFAPYTADTAHAMFSCSKTVTSMLTGIAQKKGLLKLTDSVLGYFPDVNIPSPSEHLSRMTLRDLLIMATGHSEEIFGCMRAAEDGDFARVFLNYPVVYAPGTHFVYNTGATYMLSAILTRVTGKTALQLANEWIFDPIGIQGATWESCPKGISMGGTGLHLRPRDMLRFGILLLSGGRWQDQQLIPREYVIEAQQKQIDNFDINARDQHPSFKAGYGYQLWRCSFPAYRADGLGGQLIVVFPGLDMIAVFTSALDGSNPSPLDLLEKYLLPNVFEHAQIPSPDEYERLLALSRKISSPEKHERPPQAASFPFAQTFTAPENAVGLTGLTVSEDALQFVIGDRVIDVRFCWDAPCLSEQPVNVPRVWMGMDPTPAAATARWDADGTLCLRVGYMGEPLTLHFRLTPTTDGSLRVKLNATILGAMDEVCLPKSI